MGVVLLSHISFTLNCREVTYFIFDFYLYFFLLPVVREFLGFYLLTGGRHTEVVSVEKF